MVFKEVENSFSHTYRVIFQKTSCSDQLTNILTHALEATEKPMSKIKMTSSTVKQFNKDDDRPPIHFTYSRRNGREAPKAGVKST